MLWLCAHPGPQDREAAETAVIDHLRRHAAEATAVEQVRDEVHAALETDPAGPADAADSRGPADAAGLLVELDWVQSRPTLIVRAVEAAELAGLAEHGIGGGALLAADERTMRQEYPQLLHRTPVAEEELAVLRETWPDLDPDPVTLPGVEVHPVQDGAAAVALALAAAGEAHPTASMPQTAALAGALLGDAMVKDLPSVDTAAVVDAFVEAHRALGSEPVVLEVGERHVELGVDRCPFGAGVSAAPSLCRVSAGLAGRLAARVDGQATVSLEETIAQRDRSCRLRLWLGEAPSGVVGQTYHFPSRPRGDDDRVVPQMELSLALPRESNSVPVVRRLAAQALRAFGVADSHVEDVQLAITEACANVVEHAVDTDTYEVRIELASDRCAITVLDQGGGFDATRVPHDVVDDEEGGRGLRLMRALVDNVAFEDQPQTGAVVHMVKALEYDPKHPLHRGTRG
ncbi:MAG TPA: ATP-binding protein [Nocardioidaceae bacterium]|nr:ATP-binding protein [Nocardioidaceae bacterium]